MSVSVGKWTKHTILLKEEKLVHYLPETQLFNKSNFYDFIDRYGELVLKPCFGYHGKGVSHVFSLDKEHFSVHSGFKKTDLKNIEEAFDYLKKNYHSRKQKYIVQQRILLASINHSPFDIRVMVQRKKKSDEWKVTGKLAKVAAKGFFITNAARGVIPVEEAIEKSGRNFPITDLLNEIDLVALLTAKQLKDAYPRRRTIGLDIGVDVYGKIWIIEANLDPSLSMFKLLKDETAYDLIQQYRKG